MSLLKISLSAVIVSILVHSGLYYFPSVLPIAAGTQDDQSNQGESGLPDISDSNLHADLVVEGLDQPTTMAFLGPDDLLVLEKEKGTVRRVLNGTLLQEPLLDVNVAPEQERGMLGIAVVNVNGSASVTEPATLTSGGSDILVNIFLYFTEAESDDGGEPLGNRLYKYDLIEGKLINPKLMLDINPLPRKYHNGGIIQIGPDRNLYVTSGSVSGDKSEPQDTLAMNVQDGMDPDGRAGILRITPDGQPVGNGILGSEHPLNFYYAYGIRNSFGMDFDPVTGNLWDTENGPSFADEINLVEPGFNSGWKKTQGIWEEIESRRGKVAKHDNSDNLVHFGGKGSYSTPKFTWSENIGVTALKFLDSDRLGKEYQNDILVGDVNNGYIYHFDLKQNRTELVLEGLLADRVADNAEELNGANIVFGQGFGAITDLQTNPYDGYLYVTSIDQGKVFRIMPIF